MNPTALKPQDVARRLNVPVKTVLNLLRAGKLKGFKVGRQWRVDTAQIDDLIWQRVRDQIAEQTRERAMEEEQAVALHERCAHCLEPLYREPRDEEKAEWGESLVVPVPRYAWTRVPLDDPANPREPWYCPACVRLDPQRRRLDARP